MNWAPRGLVILSNRLKDSRVFLSKIQSFPYNRFSDSSLTAIANEHRKRMPFIDIEIGRFTRTHISKCAARGNTEKGV